MERVVQDVRFALRQLRRRPVFAVVAALSLAVGIGANTAIFSAVHALLLRPVPGVVAPERVVEVGRSRPDGSGFDTFAYPDFLDLREQVAALESMSAYSFAVVPRPAHAEVPVDDVADGTQATDRFVLQIGDRVAATEAGARPVALTGIAPNPSTGVSRVAFTIPEAGPVELTVVDVRGREVSVLASGAMSAGRHEVLLRSEELAGGIYVVRLEAAGTLVTRPVVVVR